MGHIWFQNQYLDSKTIKKNEIFNIINQYKKATCQMQCLKMIMFSTLLVAFMVTIVLLSAKLAHLEWIFISNGLSSQVDETKHDLLFKENNL
jgi:hypothetical protein